MNLQDMSFGEALDWMHNNNSKCVLDKTNRISRYRIRDARLEYNVTNDECGWVDSNMKLGWQFDSRWMVVEPKSKIEEAIEREVEIYR